MEFAILFILAFLIGLGIYRFYSSWVWAVSVPMVLFTATTLLDAAARDAWLFTLIFGLPIVFFAGLLGAYVVQIRDPEYIESLESESPSSEPPSSESTNSESTNSESTNNDQRDKD